jgi:uncharacterized membrane protein YdbT with pleckstrin-like domain
LTAVLRSGVVTSATLAPTQNTDSGRELFRGRPAHASQAGSYLIAALALALGGASIAFLPNPYSYWLAGAFAILALVIALRGWLRILATAYRLSSQRLEIERGIIAKRIDNLELWRVRDVSFRQGVLDRILGVGAVLLTSSDASHPEVKIEGIKGARDLYDKLRAAVDEAHAKSRVMAIETK